jgi:magnesium transporter
MAKRKHKRRTTNYKKQLGQAPGTLVYTGEKNSNKLFIESFDYTVDQVIEKELATIEDVFSYKQTDSISWINLNGLNHITEIEKLGEHYNLHPLVLEDIVNTSQRPKIDDYNDYIFLVAQMMYYDSEEQIVNEQISFILGPNYVLTFQEAEGDVFDSLRDRIRNSKGRVRQHGSDYLLYALIDSIVDHYYAIIETMGNKVEELEDQLFEGLKEDEITNEIQILKREILKIRRAIFPLREIINRIEKSESKLIEEKTQRYFSDVYDHVIQISETIEIYREMIWSLMDMYMTNISNKMNEVMKVLTIIATIFIPLTFIAGIYGMNFQYIPELELKNGYFYIWGLMILIFIGMLYYFKRKKWL